MNSLKALWIDDIAILNRNKYTQSIDTSERSLA